MAEQRTISCASSHATGDALVEDRALLLAFHRGSDVAARALWARHAGALRSYARVLVGEADADDVVQGVFLSILEMRRSTLKEVRCPPAWLCTLTRRAALNDRRTAGRRARREAGAVAVRPVEREWQEVGALLEGVPPECREAVVLRHAYGFTLERLAEALGVSRTTAATRYARGLSLARAVDAGPMGVGESQHVG